VLQHYVFLKYREGTSQAHVQAFCERMLALRASIPTLGHLEIGLDQLHDARSWDLVLIMRFESVEALRAYQSHAAHHAVMAFNAPFVDSVASVDFSATVQSR
jgi:stress responsive alpha/beta barrel protein